MAAKKDPLYTQSEIARILSKDRATPVHPMRVHHYCTRGLYGVVLASEERGHNRLIRLSDLRRFFAEVAKAKAQRRGRRKVVARV